jgi:hypothetical protein
MHDQYSVSLSFWASWIWMRNYLYFYHQAKNYEKSLNLQFCDVLITFYLRKQM